MFDIKTFNFNKEINTKIKNMNYDDKWPMVYIIRNKNEAYIGQTSNTSVRMYQHLKNIERKKLKEITFITSDKLINLLLLI